MDTRETIPLEFSSDVEVVRKKLCHGDYALEINGEPAPIIFERKANDLFQTFSSGLKRFKKEVDRAEKAGTKLILIIDGTLWDTLDGYEYSTVPGPKIVKTIFSYFVRYDLFPVFCEDERTMARYIEETFSAIERNYKRLPGGTTVETKTIEGGGL